METKKHQGLVKTSRAKLMKNEGFAKRAHFKKGNSRNERASY